MMKPNLTTNVINPQFKPQSDRLMEVLRLRVQDLDFANAMILVRDGKGGRERSTLLPTSLVKSLKGQLAKVRDTFDEDLAGGHANVWLPNALARKYPNAPRSWEWQYVFPAQNLSTDPRSRKTRRHHMNESNLQKAVKKARTRAGISKRVLSDSSRKCCEACCKSILECIYPSIMI